MLRYTSLGSTYNTHPNPALLIQPGCAPLPPGIQDDLASEFNGGGGEDGYRSKQKRRQQHVEVDTTTMLVDTEPTTPLSPSGESSPTSATPNKPSRSSGSLGANANGAVQQVGEKRYRPAYELVDGLLERAGRGAQTKANGTTK